MTFNKKIPKYCIDYNSCWLMQIYEILGFWLLTLLAHGIKFLLIKLVIFFTSANFGIIYKKSWFIKGLILLVIYGWNCKKF